MGNMVVSNAIAANNFSPKHYYMINSVVPIEALDSEQMEADLIMQQNMTEADWYHYPK